MAQKMDANNNEIRAMSATSTTSTASSATTTSGSRPISAASCSSTDGSNDFVRLFRSFAKFGDSKSQGEAITLSNSDKWMRQAKVIDAKAVVTTVDTGIYFKQIAKTKKALSLKEYEQFLESLAKNKKLDVNDLKNRLASSGLPGTTKTTSAQVNAAVARLTDHTRYTGSHKHRFDESGKGRGKAGRVDIVSNAGYVTGYKAENTFDKVQS